MKELLHHFFSPRLSNNYRPKILHHWVLLTLILFFFSAGLTMSFVKTNFPSVLGTFSNISNQELLVITNAKRQENSLAALSLNDALSQAAANKANDMFSKDYWAHIAPDGTTPWVFIKGAGYNYIYAGENLARGFYNANDVINAWMASPEHKKNMLSSNYQNVGFAVATGKLSGEETVLIVEMLGSTNFAPAPVANNSPPEVAVAAPQTPLEVNPTSAPVLPSVTPTETPKPRTLAANTLGAAQAISQAPKQDSSLAVKPLINSLSFSYTTAQLVLFFFIFVLILDMFLLERKKIVRFVGHNLDHIFFFSMMIVVVIILAKGVVV